MTRFCWQKNYSSKNLNSIRSFWLGYNIFPSNYRSLFVRGQIERNIENALCIRIGTLSVDGGGGHIEITKNVLENHANTKVRWVFEAFDYCYSPKSVHLRTHRPRQCVHYTHVVHITRVWALSAVGIIL